MSRSWWKWGSECPKPDAVNEKQIEDLLKRMPVPVIWMFGKTGSGKSSVVQFLTGAEDATIGEGYRPETTTSRRFDFPDAEEPLLTFIDTRGLAEAAYDPTDDIATFSESTNLMIVTVRAADHALECLLSPLRQIRNATPARPVLLVVTCLHDATGAQDLSDGPDPFSSEANLAEATSSDESVNAVEIPIALQSLIDEKKRQFSGLCDAVIPVDLTPLEDGFANPHFGGDRLKEAILKELPQAYRQALMTLNDHGKDGTITRQRRARWQVLASSALAATVGAVPLPWVDIPAVLGIHTHLAIKIAKIYDQEITPARWAVLSSAAGSRVAIQLALRGVWKFIPVLGMAAGAASSFAFTYALGMSWDWYFANIRKGNVPNPDELRVIFAEQLQRGRELWRAE
jgi:uncharacterized protein (DUF697 family)